MRLLSALTLAFCATAYAQFSVDEASTRAKLVDNATSVSLALENSLGKAVDVRIDLQWLDPNGVVRGKAQFPFNAPPGKSAAEARVPLADPYEDALFFRLHYTVAPDARNLTAFTPRNGMLSFPHIADYAFRLSAVGIAGPRADRPYEFRVFAAHPITGKPVAGVQVSIGDVAAVTDTTGAAVIRVPASQKDDDQMLAVEGRLGDLLQTAEAWLPPLPGNTVRLYTDKPLYQPGQTAHVRLLVIGQDGKARANAKYSIRVLGKQNTVLHAADVATSRFGIAHTDWEIPSNAENGGYRVNVESAGNDEELDETCSIEVRRYELPSFRVSARPDKPYYFPDQEPSVEVGADFLFGKPVAGGRVRISEGDSDEAAREGVLDSAGRFRATLDLGSFQGPGAELQSRQYKDLQYTAYVTDPATNRTEQRRFDIRVSRDPLHLYVVRFEPSLTGARLYVAAYTPDGKPAVSEVEAVSDGNTLARGRTNRFGLVRLDVPEIENHVSLLARTPEGVAEQDAWGVRVAPLHLRIDTDHSLYRAGQPIRCRIASDHKDLAGTLLAWNEDGQVLFSHAVELRNGSAEAAIPYDPRFGRAVEVGFLAAAGWEYQKSKVVLYPGGEDLRITATAVKGMYKLGERASVVLHASTREGQAVEAALGIAVVDQSVLERFASDRAGTRRRWSEYSYRDGDGTSIAGVTLHDLLNLDPAKIDPDYELVAEALLEAEPLNVGGSEFADDERAAYREAAGKALERLNSQLDASYHLTLEYPTDEASFSRFAMFMPTDPWMKPYRTQFSRNGTDDELRFVSAGPDKAFGTEDDSIASTVRREWFFPFKVLIREALGHLPDYPATPAEFAQVLDRAGIRFENLRDPWQTPLRVEISHRLDKRVVQVRSAGPDRAFGTKDDFTVAEYQGTFFHALQARIEQALQTAPSFPTDEGQLRAVLAAAGIDLDRERDPWGQPYYATFRTDVQYGDTYKLYTYAEYGSLPENRRDVIPTKFSYHVVEIRSPGEDRLRGTYDDPTVARFRRQVKESLNPEPSVAHAESLPANMRGKGTVAGVVLDPTGALIPGVDVTLNETYQTNTDESGKYVFQGVPPGTYTVRFSMTGFKPTLIGGVPVQPDHVTKLDTALSLGTISEEVAVTAAPTQVQTTSSQVSQVVRDTATSTPRVREYFPETLLWNPELVTDAKGRATLDFKLADSITSWHVAVVGSTEDGQIAEAGADIKAFQPFFVDLDPPQVLTAGDEISLPVPIRNYLEKEQTISVEVAAPPALALSGPARHPERIAASASANSVLRLRAAASADAAKLRVTARAKEASDAIEKPVSIHPDGRLVTRSVSDVIENGRLLRIEAPAEAMAGSIHAEVKIYPSLLAQVIESIEAMLQKPSGCAEQTISLSYPNLFILRALKESGLHDEKLEVRARHNLESGYARLLGYKQAGGGFSYWNYRKPDIAVTAYAIEFLEDAAGIIETDTDVIDEARAWLSRQKPEEAAVSGVALRALVGGGRQYEQTVVERLGALAREAVQMDDPYSIAAFAMAALDARHAELARPAIERLRGLAREEQGIVYWHLQRNTPYYGWGRAGRIEATALTITALSRWRKQAGADPAISALIDRGVLFLVRNKDEYGLWRSTQATVRAYAALLETAEPATAAPQTVQVRLNGAPAGQMRLPGGLTVQGPVALDVSRLLKPGMINELSFEAPASRLLAQARFTASWYQPWKGPVVSDNLALSVRYSATQASPNEAVRCDVTVSRPGFRGYGMVIAEIGLPPGAEVDRGTLAGLLEKRDAGVDSFEVAPDHVTFYVWPPAADSKFSFTFRPRYPERARTAPSAAYDYYNPDESVALPPTSFVVLDR